MERLKLAVPSVEHEKQVMALRRELLERGEGFHGCNGLNEVVTYGEWLDFDRRNKAKGWVPSKTWLAVRQSDGRVVGMIDYRSPLTEHLFRYGGNIGYSTRPSDRRKGYGAEMLRLALEKCREAGEKRVLITCDKDNTASARTILANGGVLENEVEDGAGLGGSGILQRYWITLQ